ncbi:MAG TPA: hypothetical protein VF290_25840 [Pyrinomonadaceae bacterium]
MRLRVLVVLALSGLILLPIQVKAQDKKSDDKTWPYLGSAGKGVDERRPLFLIESERLEKALNVSNPLAVTRCIPTEQGCIVWLHSQDFFSEWKGYMDTSVLRPDVIMHHYPHALVDRHYRSTGTYVFYLLKHNVFYLSGDCAMGHGDVVAGPFAGDPRLVLKKLADDPDAVAELGMLLVPFQIHDATDEAWPAIPGSGIDIGKLERAQGVVNPLALDRCRASSDQCVMNMEDFSSTRKNKSGKETSVLRPGVIAHYYPGLRQQYVFYLPTQNIFYVAGFNPELRRILSGPFAGDPRLVLKKLTAAAMAK